MHLNILGEAIFLTLTPYEVGNVIWREATLLNRISIDEALSIISSIDSIYRVMNMVVSKDNQLVLELAYKLRLTYYDSL